MKTLKSFHTGIHSVPAATAWYLADIGESRGKQDLFVRQAPQKLQALREHFMSKTLTRHGNNLALVIDKPILEQMGIDACK